MKRIQDMLLQGLLLAFIGSSLIACGKNETILITKEETQSAADVILEETYEGLEEADQSLEGKDERLKTTSPSPEKTDKISEESGKLCYVHISGAVSHPGVITLKEGSHVFEAIELAGGFLATADEDYVNQALKITDGIQIYIPTVEEVEQGTVAGNQSDGKVVVKGNEKSSGKICLNTATIEELCTLSGIGKSRAEAILQYREEQGAFSTIEEIKNIAGIKDGLFDKIKDKITVQ